MPEPIEMLEQRIDELRTRVRRALVSGDRDLARSLRRELRDAESTWEDALADLEKDQPPQIAGQPGVADEQPASIGDQAGLEPAPPADGPADDESPRLSVPLREQVHRALTLLTVPAGPKLISAVHQAFYSQVIPGARLTSLRRDEERSFRAAPFARPYYLCAALTADLLAPARGLLAVSTWPFELRVIGSLSSRVYFLTAAIRVAEGIQRLAEPGPAATRLLWRFAENIPGGTSGGSASSTGPVDPRIVVKAAETELEVHADADTAVRRAAARRARDQLDDVGQLFGGRLRDSRNEQHIRPA